MGIVSGLFKEALKEVRLRGEKYPEEREIDEVIRAANSMFAAEKKEKKLFYEEISMVQSLCRSAADIIALNAKKGFGKDEKLELLMKIFLYLRSHTIDKFSQLRKIRRDAVIIIAEAKECEKYDRMIAAVKRRKSKKSRKEKLEEVMEDLGEVISFMKDIEDKAEDVEKIMDIIEKNTENMLLILGGQYEIPFEKAMPLPRLLKEIRAGFPTGEFTSIVFRIEKEIKSLDEILTKELKAMPTVRRSLKAIEIRRNRVLALMKQTGLRAA
jgi:hypothetical protein